MENTWLIVSDLDGTLLGDDEALERFARWLATARERLRLVYNSGRFFDEIRAMIGPTPLPAPDAVIGGVGTEIRLFPDGAPLDDWPSCPGHWEPGGIESIVTAHEGIEPQPDQFQAEFKRSFYAHDLDAAFLVELRRRLALAGHEVELVYSSNRDLDVLPLGVDKGSAAAFLASRWGVPTHRVIAAGDTGNDLAMFTRGFRGIAVGNAGPELKTLHSPEVYHAEHHYADGVLDGVRYWLAAVHAR